MNKFGILSQLSRLQKATLVLRVGLGLVFAIGGLSKLSLLLNSSSQAAMVAKYLGPAGYVNQFFHEFLFQNGVSPWLFLTGLSAFEFLSGLMLVAGVLVRPLSLTYGFLLWSFVISLPVVTTPGVEAGVKTYTSPAILVMIRDIALSGLMFVLFNLGSGPFSLDKILGKGRAKTSAVSWDSLSVLTRLSLGFVFLVGGLFHGMDHIQSFATPALILIGIGLVLISGIGIRYAGFAAIAALTWYMAQKFSIDKSVIANLNGVKREFALLAASLMLASLGGGKKFRLPLPPLATQKSA